MISCRPRVQLDSPKPMCWRPHCTLDPGSSISLASEVGYSDNGDEDMLATLAPCLGSGDFVLFASSTRFGDADALTIRTCKGGGVACSTALALLPREYRERRKGAIFRDVECDIAKGGINVSVAR